MQTLAGYDGPSDHLVDFAFHHDWGRNNERLRRDSPRRSNSCQAALSLFDPTASYLLSCQWPNLKVSNFEQTIAGRLCSLTSQRQNRTGARDDGWHSMD
jgi:hypothetical protein